MVELIYLTVVFASLGCECHPPSSCFICTFHSVNSGENPRTGGSVIFYDDGWTSNLFRISACRGFRASWLFLPTQRVKFRLSRFQQ